MRRVSVMCDECGRSLFADYWSDVIDQAERLGWRVDDANGTPRRADLCGVCCAVDAEELARIDARAMRMRDAFTR